jgi:hypothetical protein
MARRETGSAGKLIPRTTGRNCWSGPHVGPVRNHVEQAHEPVVRSAQVTSLMVDQICSSEKQRSKPIKSTRAAYPHSSHRLIELVFSSDTYV